LSPGAHEPAASPPPPAGPVAAGVRARIATVGERLGRTHLAVLAGLPDAEQGPQALARALGVDKVFASRLLKALRPGRDPLAVVYHAPGPEPLRRFLRAARRRGADPGAVAAAEEAVDGFRELIRRDAGDRSGLDAMLSAWLPEARAEFELRRKQTAFRAQSELKGVSADTNLATVFLHPSDDGVHLDVVWLIGLLGLRRLRPGAAVKFATRRMAPEPRPRAPRTLAGDPAEGLEGLRLDAFCFAPPARLEMSRAGDVVHYTLGGEAFGPRAAVDLVLGEVNRAEMPRRVPAGSGRKGYVFAEVGTPCRRLLFDVFVHREVYPGAEPSLVIYDTVLDGVADINDPTRDIDRLDMDESLRPLGTDARALRAEEMPRYTDLVAHVLDRLGWDAGDLSAWRCRIDHPLYGSQVAVTFDPPTEEAPPADT